MVATSFSPVGRAVLDDIVSCDAELVKSDTYTAHRLAVDRMVALSRKMNQLHNDGILTESEFTTLNLALLVLGIRGMNRLYRMQGDQHINKQHCIHGVKSPCVKKEEVNNYEISNPV